MGIFRTIENWWASLRATPQAASAGFDLPSSGRSSAETNTLLDGVALLNNRFGSVSPVINFELLSILKKLWLYNPDFSQFVENIQNLGNPGHDLIVDARTDAATEAAIQRLNEQSARIYPRGAGVDGLINAYLAQVAWSGAISSEDVVDLGARRVDKVVIVPVEQIRFRYLDGEYRPFQRAYQIGAAGNQPFGLIPLNENTYKYFAVQTVENSPYAKPPATAAIAAIAEAQEPAVDNIKYIAQKLGLLGLITVGVTPPPKRPSETDAEHATRSTDYLKHITDRLSGNLNKGLIATFRDQKVDSTSVASGAQGTSEIFQVIEEQVFSGMGSIPAMHGRTYSTTETYADVVYSLLLSKVGNFQRPIKRRMEQTYRLDLRVGGMEVDGVSLQFKKAHSRNALQEAQAEQVRQTVTFADAERGMISPDETAQQRGYDSAYDEELLTGSFGANKAAQTKMRTRFSFNRATSKYEFQRDSYAIMGSEGGDNVVPIKKKQKSA